MRLKIKSGLTDLNVTVINLAMFFLLKTLALEGNVFTSSHCSASWAHVQKRVIVSLVVCANLQTSSSEAAVSSECKLILKAGPSIQNTVLFHKSVLVLLVGIHMETDETYSLFLCKHLSTHFFIFSLVSLCECPGVQESIIFQTEVSTLFLPLRKHKLCRNKGKLSSGPGWSQSAASTHLPWEVPGQGTGEEEGGREGRTWRVGDFPALERIAQVSLDIQLLKPDTLYQCEHHSCKPCV